MNSMHGTGSLVIRYVGPSFMVIALLGMAFAGSAAAASPSTQGNNKGQTTFFAGYW